MGNVPVLQRSAAYVVFLLFCLGVEVHILSLALSAVPGEKQTAAREKKKKRSHDRHSSKILRTGKAQYMKNNPSPFSVHTIHLTCVTLSGTDTLI